MQDWTLGIAVALVACGVIVILGGIGHKPSQDGEWQQTAVQGPIDEAIRRHVAELREEARAEQLRREAEADAERAAQEQTRRQLMGGKKVADQKAKDGKPGDKSQIFIHPDDVFDHLPTGREFVSNMSRDMREKMGVVTDVKAQEAIAGVLDALNEKMIQGEVISAEMQLAYKAYYLAGVAALNYIASQKRLYLSFQIEAGGRSGRLVGKWLELFEVDQANALANLSHYDPLMVGEADKSLVALKRLIALKSEDSTAAKLDPGVGGQRDNNDEVKVRERNEGLEPLRRQVEDDFIHSGVGQKRELAPKPGQNGATGYSTNGRGKS